MLKTVCWMWICVYGVFYIIRSLAIRQTTYTDSNSQAPLSNRTTWLKRGGRTTSHFGDGVSFHGAHTHTHTAVYHRGRSGYFGGKVIGAGVRSFPSRIESSEFAWSCGSNRQRAYKRREKEEFWLAHLKCAPVCRALSATDSVCSLLQDGGSAPIHFLLIASQLSLSIRHKTQRFQTSPPGTSSSISSLTNGCTRRRLEASAVRFSAWQSSGGCGALNGGCSNHRRGALCVSARGFSTKKVPSTDTKVNLAHHTRNIASRGLRLRVCKGWIPFSSATACLDLCKVGDPSRTWPWRQRR